VVTLLKLRDVHVSYDKKAVVKGVSLEIAEGEIVTLIGSNGAGKTTLLRTISGIKDLDSGEILFMGRPIQRLGPHKIVELGLGHVPEGRHVFPEMTVLENLQMGAFLRKDQKQVKRDLETVFDMFPRLKERMTQLAGTLSGGEQQMLAVGRVLMSCPKLVMFDEPSLGIAPIIVAEIMRMIQRLNEQGTTVLLVEQNANLALKISHRAYVLEAGTIRLSGASADLLNDERVRKIYLGYGDGG
jgi:branched-chain amino acid transport system ATP-binding protein